MKSFIRLFFLLFLPFGLIAQASFTATTDAKQVPIGEVFEIEFSLKNAQGQGFRPPTFGEFNVVSGPNKMNSMTMTNGITSSSESYSYVLQAKKEGVFTLGVATITAKGQTMRTDPLSISVTKGKKQTIAATGSSKDDVFVRAEASSTEGRVGQQLIVDYKLYTRVNLSGVNRISEATYDGFYKLDVNDYTHADTRAEIGGKMYLTRTLQRLALFPQKEGVLGIEPLTLQVSIVKESQGRDGRDDDPFGQFFSSPNLEQKIVTANALIFTIKPLPPTPPPSFTSGVGNFEAAFSLSKTNATTDDALSLRLVVRGNGDAKRWTAPKLAPIDGLELYEPKILKEQSIENQGEWQTEKEIEYLIVPKKTGDFLLKTAFSYFDTEGGKFRTIDTTFTLHIQQGNNKAATLLQDRPQDIKGLKFATVLTSENGSFYNSLLYWALLIAPILLFGLAVALKQIQLQLSRRDATLLRQENAPKIAEQRLAVAQDFLAKGDRKLFYEEVSKSLFNYISDKFQMPLSEFSKSNVREKLTSLKINDQYIGNFIKILNDCEVALFAGQDTEGGATGIYEQAVKVITDIEQSLK
ncbi:MAG: BatD family protein [Saprospiraceae bacterium]|nr:BatD family protein [Saprospiraceae bacterium]